MSWFSASQAVSSNTENMKHRRMLQLLHQVKASEWDSMCGGAGGYELALIIFKPGRSATNDNLSINSFFNYFLLAT